MGNKLSSRLCQVRQQQLWPFVTADNAAWCGGLWLERDLFQKHDTQQEDYKKGIEKGKQKDGTQKEEHRGEKNHKQEEEYRGEKNHKQEEEDCDQEEDGCQNVNGEANEPNYC